MDNIKFDIMDELRNIDPILEYINKLAGGYPVLTGPTSYAIIPKIGLVLFKYEPREETLRFLNDNPKHELDTWLIKVSPKTFDIAWKDFVKSWLNTANPNDYNPSSWESDKEDFDGSIGKGFRAYCDRWGHVGESTNAFVVIKPVFAWYGK